MKPHLCDLWTFWVLVSAIAGEAFIQRPGLTLECVGNVLKLTLDKSLSLGRQLEVEVINGSQIVTLTPTLAAQCGYSMVFDPWGTMRLYTSLLSCFAHNHGDAVFDIELRLQLYGNRMSDDVLEVEKTCRYNRWASREILCERNFMEVSVHRGDNTNLLQEPIQAFQGIAGVPVHKQASTTLGNIWRMVFYTPKEKPMMLEEVQKAGYGVSVTPTRLVLRSAYNTNETYLEDVNRIQMAVFKVSTYFRQAWSVTIINGAAACPTGGLKFTDELITWFMPQYITPLLAAPQHRFLEMSMGINGRRLNQTEMKSKGYTLMLAEQQIIVSLPVGGTDGYYKSTVLDNEYHLTYCIEPMLEMLWLEGGSEITRYRVHYPIETPPQARPPHITDHTVPGSEVFNLILGVFLSDVVLMSITLSTGVLSVDEAKEKGFNVQERSFTNGSKAFSVQVPFSDPAVLTTNINPLMTVYDLPLTFGLLVLPEHAPFSYSASVEAVQKDLLPLDMNGFCDDKNFYITIGHRRQGVNFEFRVGVRNLSADLYMEYSVHQNATRMNMTVPFLAQDVVYEAANRSSLRARIDVIVSYNNWQFNNFSLACSFPFIMTECLANGTITTLAVKVESASWMTPSQLTLRDSSCKPVFSNSLFALFSFNANSCQTTRMFRNGFMIYQNEISMETGGAQLLQNGAKNGSNYRVVVMCSYNITKTMTTTFSTSLQAKELHADPGFGELNVRLRLSRDASYKSFYEESDYPVELYLKNPVYFEVELMRSTDPWIELVLEHCWASTNHGGSMLSWDLIVNGCMNPADRYQITFYPVAVDDRVRYPSHVRRFKLDMFTFIKDDMPLRGQILVQCEVILCDVHRTGGVCSMQCPLSEPENRRGVYGCLLLSS